MTRRLHNPLVAAAATLLLACSATTGAELPVGDGNVAGGPSTSSSQPSGNTADAGTPPPTQPPPSATVDAGSPPPTSWPDSGTSGVVDSGHGYFIDTGVGGYDAGVPPATGPLGSCGNPAGATDLSECGCTATDSAGNTVQLGCQAGGQCGCFVNQQLHDNPFDENGACATEPATAQQFLQYCTCN